MEKYIYPRGRFIALFPLRSMATRTEIDTLIFYVLDEPNRQLLLKNGLGSVPWDVRVSALRGLQDLGWIDHHGIADYEESYSLTKDGRRIVASKPALSSMSKCVVDHLEAIRSLYSAPNGDRKESLKKLITKECELGNWDSALLYCHDLRTIGEKTMDPASIAFAYSHQGRVEVSQNHWDEALESYLNAIEKYMEAGDRKGVCATNRAMGVIYGSKGDHASAIRCFESSLSMAKTIGDRDAMAMAHGNLAIIYDLEGRNDESESASKSCLEYFLEIGDLQKAARASNNLGVLNLSRNRFQEAVEYFDKTIRSSRTTKNIDVLGAALVNAGYCYARTGILEPAILDTDEAVSIFRESNDQNMLALAYRNYGVIEFRNGNHEKAFQWFEKGVRTASTSGVEDTYAACCYEYGLALIKSVTNLKLAKKLLTKSARTYRSIGNALRAREAETILASA